MTFHLLLSAAFLIFPAGMAFAASMDLLTMTIPNRLCLALALGFFVFALISSAMITRPRPSVALTAATLPPPGVGSALAVASRKAASPGFHSVSSALALIG